MIGSINTGPALAEAFLNAWIAAISKDNWSESTGWKEPYGVIGHNLGEGRRYAFVGSLIVAARYEHDERF